MNRQVVRAGQVNPREGRSRSERESEKGGESVRADPKRRDLAVARLKVREGALEGRTRVRCKGLGGAAASGEMPSERRDSWFSPKSLEGEPSWNEPSGVAHCNWKGPVKGYCLVANVEVGRGPRGVRRGGRSSCVKRATAQIVR